jgi:hypothetical protein
MGEGMCCGNYTLFLECSEILRLAVEMTLEFKATPPILLTFATEFRVPAPSEGFVLKTLQNRFACGPEAPPVTCRAHRKDSVAIRTTPAFHPQGFFVAIKKPSDIAMPPDPMSGAPQAMR